MRQILALLLTAVLHAFGNADFTASFPSLQGLGHHHRHLATSDYEVLCERFESIYGTCACSMNPDAALGVITTSAFISCTPPNKIVEANFTSNDRYLSSLLYCNDLKDTCINVTFSEEGSATDCSVDYVVSGETPTACSSCSPCSLNTTSGFDIDCSNIFAEATTNGCASPEMLLEFDPFQQELSSGGAAWTVNIGVVGAALISTWVVLAF